MRMIKYITLSQFIYWAENTSPFTFDGVTVDPSAQWTALNTTIKPFLDGSLDNPYSTTTPKEKLPQYFSTAAAIGIYLGDEYGDRLVAVPFRGGEFYLKFNRNLNKDEAMEIIMQELLSKATSFVSIYGFQFLKLFGTSSLKYDPRYSIQEHIKKVYDFGQHITTDQYGNKEQTQQHGAQSKTNNYGQVQLTDQFGKTTEEIKYGNTSQTTQYGAQQLTDQIGGTTDTHSETQMNDLTFKNKSQDAHSTHTDTHSTTQHSDTTTATTHTDTREVGQHSDTHTTAARTDSESKGTYTDTITDATHTDTNTSQSHQNVETTDREATGVKTIQELLSMERQLLDWNPALAFFKAFTDKILLRAYYY